MKKIMVTMFGVLASIPVSLLSTATVSANPYPGYMPPPWVRPAVMPSMPYRTPYATPGHMHPMIPMPYASPGPVMRPWGMRPMARPMRPSPMQSMAQRRMPPAPTRQFAFNSRRSPAPAVAGRMPHPANQIARAPWPNHAAPRVAPGSVQGYAPRSARRPAPRPAWAPARPIARHTPPARQFYPGLAQFRPQYRFKQPPMPRQHYWGRMPAAQAQAPRYFQPPFMHNDPRRLARAPAPVWRAPAAQRMPVAPPRQMARQSGRAQALAQAPHRMNHARPPRYANQATPAPQRYGYQPNRYRPYQPTVTQSQRPVYGTRQVSYAYGRR